MPHPFQIFSQSYYLIQIVDINSHSDWQTVQIQISWLLQKPTDLDLHCLQVRIYPGSAGQGLIIWFSGKFLASRVGEIKIKFQACCEETKNFHYQFLKQEAHGPRFALLINTAIARVGEIKIKFQACCEETKNFHYQFLKQEAHGP